jgi:putative redox protein
MPNADVNVEAVLITETRAGKYQVEVKSGQTTFFADEPVAVGGLGSGPDPYDLLGAALGSCTAMTLRLYADQKKWPLQRVRVRVSHSRSSLKARDIFNRDIHIEGPLDDTQRARLIEIAGRCPVHVTLERGSDITTKLVSGEEIPSDGWTTGPAHMKTMEEAEAE